MELNTTSQVAALNKAADAAAHRAAEQFKELAAITRFSVAAAQSESDVQLSELCWTNEDLRASLCAANDEVERLKSVEQRLTALLAGEQLVARAEGAARAQLEAEVERRETEITQLRAQVKRASDELSAERTTRAAERAAAAEALAGEHAASAAALRRSVAGSSIVLSGQLRRGSELADEDDASAGKLPAGAPESASGSLRLQLAHVTALLSVRDEELRRERAARASDAISHAALLEAERSSAWHAPRQRGRGALTDEPEDQPRSEPSEEGDETRRRSDDGGVGEIIKVAEAAESRLNDEARDSEVSKTAEAEAEAEKDEVALRRKQSRKSAQQQDELLRSQLGLPPSPCRKC